MRKPPISILQAGGPRRLNETCDKHYNGYWSFQYMDSGRIEVWYDDRRYELEGQWFWPAYPGPRCRIIPLSKQGWVHQFVSFKGDMIDHWRQAGLLVTHPQVCPKDKDYGQIMNRIARLALSRDRLEGVKAVNRLEGLLIELAEIRYRSEIDSDSWLQIVTDRLSGNVSSHQNYQQLAEQCGMSLSSLRQKFRKRMGGSLHAYALQSRLQEAKLLLSRTDLPIKAVSERLGYNDIGFFSRQFRKFTGFSPAAFRKSY